MPPLATPYQTVVLALKQLAELFVIFRNQIGICGAYFVERLNAVVLYSFVLMTQVVDQFLQAAASRLLTILRANSWLGTSARRPSDVANLSKTLIGFLP